MTRKTLTILIGLAVASITLITGAAALEYQGDVTIDQPDNQHLEVNISFSGSVTDHPIELSRDGTVVQSTTVSGSSGGTATATLSTTGLSDGEFNLTVPDNTALTVERTELVTTHTNEYNLSEGDTVTAEVGFDGSQTANATVVFDQINYTNTSTLQFDPVEASGGNEVLSTEYTANEDGNVSITTTVNDASLADGVWTVKESPLFGSAGTSSIPSELIQLTALAISGIVALYLYVRMTGETIMGIGGESY